MTITDQDIARAARELRDEENGRLHVRPWRRHARRSLPYWLAATPAAAVAGFVLGLWTSSHTRQDLPLMAQADTVYVTVRESADLADTAHAVAMQQPAPAAAAMAAPGAKSTRQKSTPAQAGQPMAADRIRYDLLVKN